MIQQANKTPTANKPRRTLTSLFGDRLGVTEWFYILGLLLLAVGLGYQFGWPWSLVVAGGILLATAFYNDSH